MICPVTGLPVHTLAGWQSHHCGDGLQANFSLIGQSVIYSAPNGVSDLEGATNSLRLNSEVAQQAANGDGHYVQIEDYQNIKRATFDARKYYIEHMNANHRCRHLIFCNLSPWFHIAIEIGKYFIQTRFKVHIVRDYPAAITLALQICETCQIPTGQFLFGTKVSFDATQPVLSPIIVMEDESWRIDLPDYTKLYIVLDNRVLYCFAAGVLSAPAIPLVDKLRQQVSSSLPSKASIDYIVVDGSRLSKLGSNTRQLFAQSIIAWHKQHPIKLYIVISENVHLRTVVQMAKPHLPFPIEIARDADQAFAIIREHKKDAPQMASALSSSDSPMDVYCEELLHFIAGINWEQDGTNGFISRLAADHPFLTVFHAIRLIKEELDSLLKERASMMQQLAASEAKYRELFEKGSDLLCIHDFDGNLLETNVAPKENYGLNDNQLSNLNLRDIASDRSRPDVDEYLARLRSNGKANGIMEARTPDGREVYLEYNSCIFENQAEDGRKVWVSARDITERLHVKRQNKLLARQLHQAQKMEAVGTLAGGIAHEFNNILGIVLGNTELAMQDMANDDPASGFLEQTRTACFRGKDVVNQLLSFSQRSELERKPVELIPLVSDSLRFLRAAIPSNIRFEADLPQDVYPVVADPTQIHQVMINLCNNAIHSMEDVGGMVNVSLTNTTLTGAEEEVFSDMAPGNYVRLKVADSGKGIEAEHLNRIFDPYFTTKVQGKGTGMGLAVVHGIVKKHNGFIRVSSEVGKGTTFEILFPAASTKPLPISHSPKTLPRGKESILFVDDEATIIEMSRRLLEGLGYTVTPVDSPVKALRLFTDNPERFDLVITDMTMPVLTGDRLARELISIRADIPIIICTGYHRRMSAEIAKEMGIKAYTTKPIDIYQLAQIIRTVLDSKQA